MHIVTKTFGTYPAAHRQHGHTGHCRFIHGHDWRFDITFVCTEKDVNDFVVDVGRLGAVKQFLTSKFDHTLLLNESDPALGFLKNMLVEVCAGDLGYQKIPDGVSFAEIVVVPNCGMEGLAEYVFKGVDLILQGITESPLNVDWISDWKNRKVRVAEVTCWEDQKNRATYKL